MLNLKLKCVKIHLLLDETIQHHPRAKYLLDRWVRPNLWAELLQDQLNTPVEDRKFADLSKVTTKDLNNIFRNHPVLKLKSMSLDPAYNDTGLFRVQFGNVQILYVSR